MEEPATDADVTTEKTAKSGFSPKKEPVVGNLEKDVYAAAAECVDAVLKRRASVKSAIFNSPFQDKRFLLALTQKTMDNLGHVKKIVYDSKLLKKEPRLTKSMAYVATYDLLLGDMKRVTGIARLIKKYEEDLKKAASKYAETGKVENIRDMKPAAAHGILHTPRYVRVNTIVTTTDEVIQTLEKEGFKLEEYDAAAVSQKTFIKLIRHFRPNTFFRDYHVPDLLVFHPTVVFYGHHLEQSGKVLLQDKASCLASLLLNPPAESVVIDACAAPGMKTSHLASLMKNQGKIFAVDINETRCETMKTLLTHAGVTCATTVNQDFTTMNPQLPEYESVTHILVDPTCTGSGVTSRGQQNNKKKKRNTKQDRQRLQKLKSLQAAILKHALSFPNVERVVYSTCSINLEEDEEVVQEAVKGFLGSFKVKPFSKYLPKWKGCGKPRFSMGPSCLRAFTEKHLTNGFFVAVIERTGMGNDEDDATEFSNAMADSVEVKIEEGADPDKKTRKRKKKYEERWTIEMENGGTDSTKMISAAESARNDYAADLARKDSTAESKEEWWWIKKGKKAINPKKVKTEP